MLRALAQPVAREAGLRAALMPEAAPILAAGTKRKPGAALISVFCSLFGSEFKALKTPPSHGFSGFGAIEVVAKCAGLRRAAAALWLAAVMKGAPGEMLRALDLPSARAGHWRCARSLAARLAGCGANAAKADASQRPGA